MLSLFLLSSSSIPLSCDLIPLYFFYMTQLSSLTSHFVLVCWNSSLANMYGSWQDAGLSFLVLFRTHPCFLSINLSSPDVTLTTTPMFVILLLQLLLLLLLLLSIGSGTESRGLAPVEPVGVRLVLLFSQCSLDSSLLIRIK